MGSMLETSNDAFNDEERSCLEVGDMQMALRKRPISKPFDLGNKCLTAQVLLPQDNGAMRANCCYAGSRDATMMVDLLLTFHRPVIESVWLVKWCTWID